MSRILIIEDELSIAELERDYLELNDFEVEIETNGAKGLDKALENDYSLILLDLMLPDLDGFEICRQIREKKDIPIIMVTARTTEIDKVKGLDMGADDYLTKPFGVMELIARVRALLRRSSEGREEKKILSLDELSMDDEKHAVYVNDKTCELTFKEYELLKMFMDNVGIVLTRENIMNRIWGTDYSGETRTVDMHIKTLRQKLGDTGNRIKTIRNVGYMLE